MSPLIRLLPKVLLGAAGLAAVAYAAWRQQEPRPVVRRIPLRDLETQLRWWLPKLSFMPPMRLGDGLETLELDSDGTEITVAWLGTTRTNAFRRACERLGWTTSTASPARSGRIAFRAPANPEAVPPAITALLRELLGLEDWDEVLVSVPEA